MDKNRKKRATSQERWELDRIKAGGAIGAADIPDYDEDAANLEAEESEGELCYFYVGSLCYAHVRMIVWLIIQQ